MEQHIDTSQPYYVYYQRQSWEKSIRGLLIFSFIFGTLSWLVIRVIETLLIPLTGGYSWFGYVWHVAAWMIFLGVVIPLANFFQGVYYGSSDKERFANPGLIIDQEGLQICDGELRLRIFWHEIEEIAYLKHLVLHMKEGSKELVKQRMEQNNLYDIGEFEVNDPRVFESSIYEPYEISDQELHRIINAYRWAAQK